MKMPQRNFVVEFKSGRRSTKVRTSSIWGDTDLKAFVRESEDTAPHPFNSNAAPRTPDDGDTMPPGPMNAGSASGHVGEVSTAEAAVPTGNGPKVAEVEVPKQHETDVLTAEVVAPVQESEPAPQLRKTSKGTHRKRAKRSAAPIAHIAMGRDEPLSAESVTARDWVSFDELAALDAENKRLNSLLAEQLHAQNVQLKKMLERFDVAQADRFKRAMSANINAAR
ncbi:hypothetical protein N2599_23275 (plasmid) [Rhizobium sullae]|uniref:Uncharacterized protein n=1 Tax=Rhizobium sullae TaxID=50338 RepID=A0A2N0D9N1_RHISU|nr:hypothetical protein [Rhizobium sullae]PKA42794.1 hypothetical protein CWR43_15375 [Rhizobium sullae]UWU18194.1 hypothetical protein N2599_23275 [Rhizobium sullae]